MGKFINTLSPKFNDILHSLPDDAVKDYTNAHAALQTFSESCSVALFAQKQRRRYISAHAIVSKLTPHFDI